MKLLEPGFRSSLSVDNNWSCEVMSVIHSVPSQLGWSSEFAETIEHCHCCDVVIIARTLSNVCNGCHWPWSSILDIGWEGCTLPRPENYGWRGAGYIRQMFELEHVVCPGSGVHTRSHSIRRVQVFTRTPTRCSSGPSRTSRSWCPERGAGRRKPRTSVMRKH